MGILLGLLTALSWGSSDFLARFATHRIGTLRTMLYMQFTGLLLLTISLPWLGGFGHLADGSGWQPWGWGVLAGILNCGATLTLFRSFEVGKLAVVAPISASYPVLTVLLSVLSGEHLHAARIAGIALTLLGVILVAGGEKKPENHDVEGLRRSGKGISWALCSAVGFGFLFWLLGVRIVPSLGAAPTVWMIRLTSSALTAALILAARKPIQPPSGRVGGWILGMGLTDTGAYVMNNLGMQVEQIAVVSVLASLYGAVTVGLAAIFLRERVSRWQWLGIASIFAGIVLISL
ncbi:MAG: DMT family transporter [Candidatus Acidiferrum sp.]